MRYDSMRPAKYQIQPVPSTFSRLPSSLILFLIPAQFFPQVRPRTRVFKDGKLNYASMEDPMKNLILALLQVQHEGGPEGLSEEEREKEMYLDLVLISALLLPADPKQGEN